MPEKATKEIEEIVIKKIMQFIIHYNPWKWVLYGI